MLQLRTVPNLLIHDHGRSTQGEMTTMIKKSAPEVGVALQFHQKPKQVPHLALLNPKAKTNATLSFAEL